MFGSRKLITSGCLTVTLLAGMTVAIAAEQTKPQPQDKPLPRKAADYVDPLGIEFVLIKKGRFLMGRDSADPYGYDPELPQHEVTIGKDFYMARFETTQALWQKIMGNNPSDFVSPDRPVENVSFEDVQQFLRKLNQGSTVGTYRLPSEAQWEYAARAGRSTAFFFGKKPSLIDHFAWYMGNTPGGSQKVGLKNPNPWGLYDIVGNVAEWVEDCWHANYLKAPNHDKPWTSSGFFENACKERVLRGGSWYSPAFELRSSYRFKHFVFNRSGHKGFRLVLDKRNEQAPK